MNCSDQLVTTCKNLLCNLYGSELISDIYRHFERLLIGKFQKICRFFTLYIFIFQRRIQDCINHQRWSVLKNSQRFSSKMEPFAKIKPVNNFLKISILDVRHGSEYAFYFQSIYENSNARILVYFKDWLFLTHFKPAFHSYSKQIN